jgi:hypothetical protein
VRELLPPLFGQDREGIGEYEGGGESEALLRGWRLPVGWLMDCFLRVGFPGLPAPLQSGVKDWLPSEKALVLGVEQALVFGEGFSGFGVEVVRGVWIIE